MRSVFVAIALLALPALAQAAEEEAMSPEVEARLKAIFPPDTKGKWRLPGTREMGTSYPARAAKAHVEGVAIIDCAVKLDGSVTDCHILSEDPPGWDFGPATMAMLYRHARVDPDTVPGGLQPDSRKRFRYVWKLRR